MPALFGGVPDWFSPPLPAFFGFQPWTAEFFVAFNVCWIALWSLCAAGVLKGIQAAYFSLWFLTIALLVNGIAHPGLSLLAGGYSPAWPPRLWRVG